MADILSNPVATIKSYQPPTIPNVTNGPVGVQPHPSFNLAGALQGIGHSIAQGYNNVAAQHQRTPFTPGASPLTASGQINALNTQSPLLGQGQSAFKTTSTGGIAFPAQHASGVATAPAKNPIIPTSQQNTDSQPQGLSSLIRTPYQTPNGGQITTDSNGNVTNFTPAAGYSIDTSGTVPSSAFTNSSTTGDVLNHQRTLQDYVDALAQANGYSPAYQQAYAQSQQAQANSAQLPTAFVSRGAPTLQNYLQNPYQYGDTMSQAQALNGQEQALAGQQQTQANIALNTQQLARTGNIAAAQAQLQYSPTAISEQNAQSQYNALQQQYAGVAIPPFDPSKDPQQQLQEARIRIATSPAYQSQFQSTFTTPGGGTGIYSKLNVNSGAFQQNADGTYTLVPAAAAALGTAQAQQVSSQLDSLSKIKTAVESTTNVLNTTQQFMRQVGLNSTDIPIINQIQNSIKDQTTQQDAISRWHNDLNAMREDYAQYITARGGSVVGSGIGDPAVQKAIPDTASLRQLQNIVNEMTTVGSDTGAAVQDVLNKNLQGLQSGGTSNPLGNTGGHSNIGTSWANI